MIRRATVNLIGTHAGGGSDHIVRKVTMAAANKPLGYRSVSGGLYRDRSWKTKSNPQADTSVEALDECGPQLTEAQRLQVEQRQVTAHLLNTSLNCDDAKSIAAGLGWAVRSAAQLTFEDQCTIAQIGKAGKDIGNSSNSLPIDEHARIDRDNIPQATPLTMASSGSRVFLFTLQELCTVIIPFLSNLHRGWIPKAWAQTDSGVTNSDRYNSLKNDTLWSFRSGGSSTKRPMHKHEKQRLVVYQLLCEFFGGRGGSFYGLKGYHQSGTDNLNKNENFINGGCESNDTKIVDVNGKVTTFSLKAQAIGVSGEHLRLARSTLKEGTLKSILHGSENETSRTTLAVARERRLVTGEMLTVLIGRLDNTHHIEPQPVFTNQKKVEIIKLAQRSNDSPPVNSKSNLPQELNSAGKHPPTPTSSLNALAFYNIGDVDPLSRMYFSICCPEPSNYLRHENAMWRGQRRVGTESKSGRTILVHSVYSFGRWQVFDPNLCNEFGAPATVTTDNTANAVAPEPTTYIQSTSTLRKSIVPRWLRKPFVKANEILTAAIISTESAIEERQDFFGNPNDPLWFKGAALDWLRQVPRVQVANGLFISMQRSSNHHSNQKKEVKLGKSTFSMRMSGIEASSAASETLSKQSLQSENSSRTRGGHQVTHNNNNNNNNYSKRDFSQSVFKHRTQNEIWEHIQRQRCRPSSNGFHHPYLRQTDDVRRHKPLHRTFEKVILDAKASQPGISVVGKKSPYKGNADQNDITLDAVGSPFRLGYKYPYWIDVATIKKLNLTLLPGAVPLSAQHLPILSSLMGIRDYDTMKVGLQVATVGDYYDWRRTLIESHGSNNAGQTQLSNALPENASLQHRNHQNTSTGAINHAKNIEPCEGTTLQQNTNSEMCRFLSNHLLDTDLGAHRRFSKVDTRISKKSVAPNMSPMYFTCKDVIRDGCPESDAKVVEEALQNLLEWIEDLRFRFGKENGGCHN